MTRRSLAIGLQSIHMRRICVMCVGREFDVSVAFPLTHALRQAWKSSLQIDTRRTK